MGENISAKCRLSVEKRTVNKNTREKINLLTIIFRENSEYTIPDSRYNPKWRCDSVEISNPYPLRMGCKSNCALEGSLNTSTQNEIKTTRTILGISIKRGNIIAIKTYPTISG